MPVEFVDGLRVSDADDRRGGQDGPRRQGQQGHRPAPEPPRPARGRPLRRRRAAVPGRPPGRAGRRGHRLRRPDRARQRRRARAHRLGLHPGDRVGRRRPRGQLLQRQRRRGRRRGRPRAAGLQGHVPHRRRGLAARPRRPVSVISEAGADEVTDRARRQVVGRDAAQARRPASTRSTAA